MTQIERTLDGVEDVLRSQSELASSRGHHDQSVFRFSTVQLGLTREGVLTKEGVSS